MDQPAKSLLKYQKHVLISKHCDTSSPKDQTQTRANDDASNCKTRDILNTVLPPRKWMVGNQWWMQEVSGAASTRTDVLLLEEELDKQLLQSQARHTGLCCIRRQLYPQCFDEIMRQVTINCAERGLLLLRIKNEFEMTLDSYQTLHESSVGFGIRRDYQAEQDGTDMKKRISALEKERDDLKKQLDEQEARCAEIEKEEKEKAQFVEEMFNTKMELLKGNNLNLRDQLAEKFKPE